MCKSTSAEREGSLEEGELERAPGWVEDIYQMFEAGRSIQKNTAVIR